jgi:N-methylhydantoinase B
VAADGRALHVSPGSLTDVGTLAVCAQLAHQYLHLKDGDVAILNDPYSGGAYWADITLVTALTLDGSDKPNLLVAKRFSLMPHFQMDASMREIGLPIPPTPIASAGVLNEGILQAMQSHPLCPPDFTAHFRDAYEALMRARQNLGDVAPRLGFDLGRVQIRDYLQESQNLMTRALSEFPSGEHTVQTVLESGERVKLHVEFVDNKAIFDFAGTETSSHLHLTHHATFGVCLAALLAAIARGVSYALPINAGVTQLLEVRTPAECFLNAISPAPTLLGGFAGTALVAQLILQVMGHIAPRTAGGENASAPCLLHFDFGPNCRLFDAVFGGGGAMNRSEGTDAMSFWNRVQPNLSVESVEQDLPLVIRTVATRSLSGGLGLHRGGHGMIKIYECLAAGKLYWWSNHLKLKPEGYHGAKDGAPSEVYLARADGERIDLDAFGAMQVHVGDSITVMSAGGGGYEAIPVAP